MRRPSWLVAIGALLAACRSRGSGPAQGEAASLLAPSATAPSIVVPPATPDAASIDGPADVQGMLARLDLAARRRALHGAWVTVDADGSSDVRPRAIAIDADGAVHDWDGRTLRTWRLGENLPCEVLFLRPGSDTDGIYVDYVVHEGVAEIGLGFAGERVGRGALVCAAGGTYVLDDAGRCAVLPGPGDGEARPARCGIRPEGGHEVFSYDDDSGHSSELAIDGWRIGSVENHGEPGDAPWAGRYPDFAAARAVVERDADADDPLRLARAAGGRVGDTSTVAGLIATFAEDRKSLRGTIVQVRGVLLDRRPWTGTDGSGDYLRIGDPTRREGLWIGCEVHGAEAAADGADVVVEGRVDDGEMNATWTSRVTGVPGLFACHVR